MGMDSKDQEGIPVPLHSFGSSIVRFVSLITEFQYKYLLKEYECGERFFFGVERVKEVLLKLEPGLQVAQREIPKYNSRIREWYLKVKDIVYQLEDLFEDIELQGKCSHLVTHYSCPHEEQLTDKHNGKAGGLGLGILIEDQKDPDMKIFLDEASNYFNSWSHFELAYPHHPGPGLKSFDLDPLYYKLRLDWRTIDHIAMDHEFVQHCGFDGLVSDKVRHAL
nr:hypothetical protein CFP56_16119 [Quercus suber]